MARLVAIALVVVGCTTSPVHGPAEEATSPLLFDGSSSGGRSGFAFLAPLGALRDARCKDTWAALRPDVQIDEIDPATGRTLAVGPRLTFAAGDVSLRQLGSGPPLGNGCDRGPGTFFDASWRTARKQDRPGTTHRVRVLVDGHELGFSDVVLVSSAAGGLGHQVAGNVRVVVGQTLQIRFVISQPAVDGDLDGVLDWADNCPALANADQLDSVGNGKGDACRCDGVVCAPIDECHVAGLCVPSTGLCTMPARPDGSTCTQGRCEAGSCVPDRCASLVFSSADVPTSGLPWMIERLDFDGDGDLDLVSGEYFGGVSSFQNDGAGRFTKVSNSSSPLVYSLEVADMDGDGALDVVVGNYLFSTVSIHRSLGGGVFAAAQLVPVNELWAAWPVDVNLDGRHDLVVGRVSGLLDVHLQTGAGTFSPPVTYDVRAGLSRPADVQSADLNGDALPDLVIANGSSVTVLAGTGGGAFGAPQHFRVGSTASRVALADLDGDRALDAVSLDVVSNVVDVWRGLGDGSFVRSATLTVVPALTTASPGGVSLADLDGDARLDVVVASWRAGAVLAFLGEPSGWSGPVTLTTSPEPTDVTTGDFDGDGKVDLAMTDQSLQQVRVLLNQCR